MEREPAGWREKTLEGWQITLVVVGVFLIGNNVFTDRDKAVKELLTPFQTWMRLTGFFLVVVAAVPAAHALL